MEKQSEATAVSAAPKSFQAPEPSAFGGSAAQMGRSFSPPAFQLKATSAAPIQRLGGAAHPQEQEAGTCGLISLVHSVAWLYNLNEAQTIEVRRHMLAAAGAVDEKLCAQGEITSFAIAQTIIAQYNRRTHDYKVDIHQQEVTNHTSSLDWWREALGLPEEVEEDNERDHAAILFVDADMFYAGVTSALNSIKNNVMKDQSHLFDIDAIKRAMYKEEADTKELKARQIPPEYVGLKYFKGNEIELNNLNTREASQNGEAAHIVTITGITRKHLIVQDPNHPDVSIRIPMRKAKELTLSLENGTRGQFFDGIYRRTDETAQEHLESAYVSKLKGDDNRDWQEMYGEPAEGLKAHVENRLLNTDRDSRLNLRGLAIRVTRQA